MLSGGLSGTDGRAGRPSSEPQLLRVGLPPLALGYPAVTGGLVITLTDTASVKVKELISQEGQDGLMLRVAVRPGGCSGFSYEMFFDTEKDAEDMVLDQLGVAVVVDPSSAQHLVGATLDYKDGLQGAGFAIDNPNAQKTCGCGQSFS